MKYYVVLSKDRDLLNTGKPTICTEYGKPFITENKQEALQFLADISNAPFNKYFTYKLATLEY